MTSVTLLGVLNPAERQALTERLIARRFRRAQVVFNDGDRGDCLYLVKSGRFEISAATYAGHTLTLRVVQPGEMFGELALVHPAARRTGRAVALEAAEVDVLRRADVDELRAAHPGIDRFLVAVLAERLVRTSEITTELLLPPETRVWRRVAALAEAYGDEPIVMSQDTLAHLAGTVRQTANRVLRSAAADGIVEVSRGSIRVLDPTRVAQLAALAR